MTELHNLWNLMRLPMQLWWERSGRWICLPVGLLSLAAALHFMLMPNMPLHKWVLARQLVSGQMLSSVGQILQIPIMLLMFAFIGLWACAARACDTGMRRLLEESAAPAFDASPLHRFLICYSQGLILLPIALIIYTALGCMDALAARVQPQVFQTAWQISGNFGTGAAVALEPQHYTGLLESISQYSASAFGIAAISMWITALFVAGGSLAGFGFLALRSLDVSIFSAVLLLGSRQFMAGRPLVRDALPQAEFWLCIPFLLLLIVLLGRSWPPLRRMAYWGLALFALSPVFFAAVLPRSIFIEDTLFARLVNSLRYMHFGISGPVFQVKASIIEAGNVLRFREHLMLFTDSKLLLFSCTGSGVMLAWIGNLLVLAVIMLLVMAALHLGVTHRRRIA